MPECAAHLITTNLLQQDQLAARTKVLGLDLDVHRDLGDQLLTEFCRIKPPFPHMWIETSLFAVAIDVVGEHSAEFTPFAYSQEQGIATRGETRVLCWTPQGELVKDSLVFPTKDLSATWPTTQVITWEVPTTITKEDRHKTSLSKKQLEQQRAELQEQKAKLQIQHAELDCMFAILAGVATLSFLHCHNVRLTPLTLRRQQRRRLERCGVDVKYEVLEIAGVTYSSTPTPQHTWHSMNRLHVVRGHFKTWTKDKPLFGKYVGTWYVPNHVRGNPDQGAISKTYAPVP